MKLTIVLLLLAVPSLADQYCVDLSTSAVNPANYQAPASTTATKTSLLQQVYAMRYERDRNRNLWIETLLSDIQHEDRINILEQQNRDLWRILFATRTYLQ